MVTANDSIEMRLRDEESQWSMEDLETAIRAPPFIFELPESICNANPDALLPRRIALGPHNGKNKMKYYKLYMAKKVQEELVDLPEFDQLHAQLRTLKLKILACYDSHLEIDSHDLAEIMLVDALFLLRLFLNISAQMQNYSSNLRLPLPNFDDQNLVAQFLILSDVLKLQNQIPLLVFKAILPPALNDKFPVFLYHFCKSVSPFALGFFRPNDIVGEIMDQNKPMSYKSQLPNFQEILNQSQHLLHFMYYSILIFPMHYPGIRLMGAKLQVPMYSLKKGFSILRSFLDDIDFIQQLNEAIGLIQELLELIGMVRKQTSALHKTTFSPVIPSASQLHKLRVKFVSTKHGILRSKFIKDPGTITKIVFTRNRDRPRNLIKVQLPATLTLPVITVNAFTETLFENLLVFEAMANINPPVFARYIDLMKALVPTSKDFNILKDAKIIYNHLDNDEEVVELFKRVGSSMISSLNKPSMKNLNRLHQYSYKASDSESESETESESKNNFFEKISNIYEKGLKGMVEEINQYYESFWIVKAKRYLKKSLYWVVKMVAILLIVFQVFLVAEKLVSSIIGNDEPNYKIVAT